MWRKPESIKDSSLKYINEIFVNTQGMHEELLNAFLTISTNIDHPYNADFLHKHLKSFELAQRDAWWSVFLYCEYEEHRVVDSLVDWGRGRQKTKAILMMKQFVSVLLPYFGF